VARRSAGVVESRDTAQCSVKNYIGWNISKLVENKMTTIDCKQCIFIKANGQRCKRRTCVRKDYCWQHLRAKKGIDVRPSSLGRRSGMGLFAFKPFGKGDKVADYSGVIVNAKKAKKSQYAVAWSKGKFVDASSSQDPVGRYANTCRGADKKAKRCKGNNVKIKRDFRRKTISLRVGEKAIKKGDEIFNTYGGGFKIVR
jgi:hypothetical protein